MVRKENKLFIAISLILTFTLFLSIFSGKVFSNQITALNQRQKAQNSEIISINWEEIYPYDTEVYVSSAAIDETTQNSSLLNKLISVSSKFGKLGENWSGLMYKYSDISKLGYIINSKLTDPSIGKSYTKLKNGYWISNNSSKLEYEAAVSTVSNYYYLQNYLRKIGIDFLYCYTPSKECEKDTELPDGVTDYTNTNIDTYINAIDKLGINYIDLRKNLHNDGLNHYSLFYKTDHHWNIDGALWATSVIENEINKKFNFNMTNINDLGTFTRKTYENAIFGSAGQAVTHFNENSENFDILFPDFDNEFTLTIPDKGIDESGSFEDIFVDYETLNDVINDGGGYAYETILYGNRPYEKIVNKNNPNGPKILMIRDSFSIAVAPYLACSCSELVLIDTRSSNGNFTGSIINCINQENPDIVLALQCSPQSITLNKK